ncbi:MAG: hypothetical protein WC043_03070 [Pseudobdellovibrionaceae bacterium]
MKTTWCNCRNLFLLGFCALVVSAPAVAATAIPFTVTMSESVTVTGTPRIVLDVGGNARYATYSSGSGTSSLTFTYSATAGDVDLDGIGVSSTTLDLNGGTVSDLNGNAISNLTFTPPANMGSVFINYPSLSLDFVADSDGRYTLNGTAYNDLTSFLTATSGTFTRASTATYYDSSGTLQTAASGAARFDYDPVTHVAKGILIEESRINYLRASAAIDDAAYWNKTGTVAPIITANAALAPDGTMSAEEIDLTPATDTRPNQVNSMSGALNQNATYFSVWLKAKTAPGTISLAGRRADGVIISSTVNVTMDWQRFTMTIPASTGASSSLVYVGHRGFGGTCLNYYAWGAQLEIGTFITSYIPTTTATVTRALDNLTIPVGAWYNASTTTISGNYSSFAVNGYSTRIASLNDGTSSNVFQIADSSGGIILAQKAIGGSILNSSGPTYVPNISYKIAGAMDSSSGPLAVNNTLYSNTNAGLPPGITRIQIGNQNGGSLLNGWISQLKYYPTRVSDIQLQLLTQ